MKVQVQRTFKSFFFVTIKKKKIKKKQKSRHFLEICMKFFSDICMTYLNLQVRINKMVNEHTVDYHPSLSELTSTIHPLISHISVAKKFKIHGVKITTKCICESKNLICSFLLMSPSKNLSQVLIITTPGRRKFPNSPTQRFLYFFSAEREENYGAEKMTKIKLTRALVTSFDEFHHLSNHNIFGFCSFVPQFRFKYVEV